MVAPVLAGGRELRHRIGEAIAQIHARARGTGASKQRTNPGARLGPAIARDAVGHCRIAPGAQSTDSPRRRRLALATSRDRQPRAQQAGDVKDVPRTRAAAGEDFARLDAAHDGDVHHKWPRRTRDVAASQVNAGFSGKLEQAVEQTVDLVRVVPTGSIRESSANRGTPPIEATSLTFTASAL